MARRPNPRQITIFDLLDAAPVVPPGPIVAAGVNRALAYEVLAAILDVLPRGVPTYVREVAGVKRDRTGCLVADLVVFDGLRHTLRISGMPGARGYTWLADLWGDAPAFHWDEEALAWARVDLDEETGSLVEA